MQVWGTRERQFALAVVPYDSLDDWIMGYDGVGWRVVDPHPDAPGRTTFYERGITLDDGTIVLAANSCDSLKYDGVCRPMILELPTGSTEWRERRVGLPQEIRLWGVWGRTRDTLLVWGTSQSLPTLWEVIGWDVAPASGTPAARVVGIAPLRGVPHVLLGDGSIWGRGASGWTAVTQMPGTAFGAVEGNADIGMMFLDGYAWFHWGPGFGLSSSSEEDARSSALAVGDSVWWVLKEDGKIWAYRCEAIHEASSCYTRLGLPPERIPAPRIRDITVLSDGRLFGVGDGWYRAQWRSGHWVEEPPLQRGIPGALNETLTDTLMAVFALPQDVLVARGTKVILVRSRDGEWSPHPGGGEAPYLYQNSVAAVTTGGSRGWAFARAMGHFVSVNDTLGRGPMHQPNAIATAIHGLADGRVVVAWGTPADPLVAGWLTIWPPPYLPAEQYETVTLPRRTTVTAMADDGEYLYVVGSGWFAWRIRIDSLPLAQGAEGT